MRLIVIHAKNKVDVRPADDNDVVHGVKYCAGYEDKEEMGVSLVGALVLTQEGYTTTNLYDEHNISALQVLLNESSSETVLVTFNGSNYDLPLLKTVGIEVAADVEHYDLLKHIWIWKNLNPDVYVEKTHGGHSLNRLSELNMGISRIPIKAGTAWQQGRFAEVANALLLDLEIIHGLFHMLVETEGFLRDPIDETVNMDLAVPKMFESQDIDEDMDVEEDLAIFSEDRYFKWDGLKSE